MTRATPLALGHVHIVPLRWCEVNWYENVTCDKSMTILQFILHCSCAQDTLFQYPPPCNEWHLFSYWEVVVVSGRPTPCTRYRYVLNTDINVLYSDITQHDDEQPWLRVLGYCQGRRYGTLWLTVLFGRIHCWLFTIQRKFMQFVIGKWLDVNNAISDIFRRPQTPWEWL